MSRHLDLLRIGCRHNELGRVVREFQFVGCERSLSRGLSSLPAAECSSSNTLHFTVCALLTTFVIQIDHSVGCVCICVCIQTITNDF